MTTTRVILAAAQKFCSNWIGVSVNRALQNATPSLPHACGITSTRLHITQQRLAESPVHLPVDLRR